MMKVPFYRASIGQKEIDAVVGVLQSGWLTTGPKAKEFERNFATYMGHKHAVAVNSCTAALHLALEAIGIQSGEAVLVPTMTFAATAEVVRYFDAVPYLVDCREADLNLDVSSAEQALAAAKRDGRRVRAIIPVNYGGQVGDAFGIADFARRYELRVVEDAAHCCPAGFRRDDSDVWRQVGSMADVACYSFYANKTITTGEGGMACTDDDRIAERMRIMSLHGISKDAWKRFTSEGSWYYEIIAPGYKYNLTDIAAALGIEQLKRADDLHQRRTAAAASYSRLLAGVPGLILPGQLPHRRHSWHLFQIRIDFAKYSVDRNSFIDALKARGIGASVHWMPLHLHPYYRERYQLTPECFPVAARIYSELVSLPLFPDMTPADIAYVACAVREILGNP